MITNNTNVMDELKKGTIRFLQAEDQLMLLTQ